MTSFTNLNSTIHTLNKQKTEKVYNISDLEPNLFHPGIPKYSYRTKTDWSAEILYNHQELYFRIPVTLTAFDINKYEYPQTQMMNQPSNETNLIPKKSNYSVNLCLNPNVPGMQDVIYFLTWLDTDYIPKYYGSTLNPKMVQVSPIRKTKDKKFYDTLRCKLCTNMITFKTDVRINNKQLCERDKTIEHVLKLCPKSTSVKTVVRLNGIYCCAGKIGYSLQIMVLDIQKLEFDN